MRPTTMFVFALVAALLAACSSGVEMVPAPLDTPVTPKAPAQPASPAQPTQPASAAPATQPATRETEMPIVPFDTTPEPLDDQPLAIGGTKLPGGQPPPLIQPQPGDNKLTRGKAFVDSIKLVKLESGQYALHLSGSTPTPCHQLRVKVAEPDANNKIIVDVYTVVNPDLMCTQVLRLFEVAAPLGAHPQGAYTVEVNGQPAGSFTLP